MKSFDVINPFGVLTRCNTREQEQAAGLSPALFKVGIEKMLGSVSHGVCYVPMVSHAMCTEHPFVYNFFYIENNWLRCYV